MRRKAFIRECPSCGGDNWLRCPDWDLYYRGLAWLGFKCDCGYLIQDCNLGPFSDEVAEMELVM